MALPDLLAFCRKAIGPSYVSPADRSNGQYRDRKSSLGIGPVHVPGDAVVPEELPRSLLLESDLLLVLVAIEWFSIDPLLFFPGGTGRSGRRVASTPISQHR